jgi:hypothetical protein
MRALSQRAGRTALAAALLGLGACAIPGLQQRDPKTGLSGEHEVLEGTVEAAVLERGGERLLLVLRVEGREEAVLCVTENDEKKEILDRLGAELASNGAPVVLYGKPVTGAWREYASGVDFYFEAIGHLRTDIGRYLVVQTEYGARFQDVFRGLGWTKFLGSVAKTAAKQAF